MKLVFPNPHLVVLQVEQMKGFCRDFFSAHDIGYFDYGRYYKSGKSFHLATATEWLFKHYDEGGCLTYEELEVILHSCVVHEHLLVFLTPELSITNHLPTRSKFIKNMKLSESMDIQPRFYICNRKDDYYEVVGFAQKHTSNLSYVQFVTSNLYNCTRFIRDFRIGCSQLILEAEKDMVQLQAHQEIIDILNKHKHKLAYRDGITNQLKTANLSLQEFKCIEGLAYGKSLKQIAQTLDISPRTIECYVNRIKEKTGAQFKSELIYMFSNY